MGSTYDFAFDPKYLVPLAAFGATPLSSGATLTDDDRLEVRFGLTKLETDIANVAGFELSGPYLAVRAIGVRLSLSDRGLTFGSNTKRGVCVKFIEPVAAFPPWGTIRHPGLTLTLKDPEGFASELEERRPPALPSSLSG